MVQQRKYILNDVKVTVTICSTIFFFVLSRLFAKNGYRVALVARNVDYLNTVAGEINKDGGEVGLNCLQ